MLVARRRVQAGQRLLLRRVTCPAAAHKLTHMLATHLERAAQLVDNHVGQRLLLYLLNHVPTLERRYYTRLLMHTLSVPRSLLTTRVASASCSTSLPMHPHPKR